MSRRARCGIVGRMSQEEQILPISAALQAIGVESKNPTRWRQYWSKLGAPIVPGSWPGSRERFGADPEALRVFVQARGDQMAKEQDERSEKLRAKLQGKPVVPGFRTTLTEEVEMMKRRPREMGWDVDPFGAPCEMCGQMIPDVRVGWHALRCMLSPAAWRRDWGRSSDGLVLLCSDCLPVFDDIRRDTFSSQSGNERLHRKYRLETTPRASKEQFKQAQAVIMNEPSPSASDILEEGLRLDSWLPYLQAHWYFSPARLAHTGRRGNISEAEWSKLNSGPKYAARHYGSRSGHVRINLSEWLDRMADRPHLSGQTAEADLRLELSRGRPPLFRSAGWGTSQPPIEYAYDPSRTW